MKTQFKNLRENQIFDSRWVEKQASTKISEEDFQSLLDELEKYGKISIDQLREMEEQFIELRNPKVISFDENWVKRNAKSQISRADFKNILEKAEDEKRIERNQRRVMIRQFDALRNG